MSYFKYWSYEITFCVQIKNPDFIQQFVSSASPWHHFGEYHICKRFPSDQSVNNVENASVWRSLQRIVFVVYIKWIFSKMASGWCRRDKLLNKVVDFIFFAHKKLSRSFVKLQLNPRCHMDYFNDAFATFLDLDCVNYIAVYGRVRELRINKNILICVPKMNSVLNQCWHFWVN